MAEITSKVQGGVRHALTVCLVLLLCWGVFIRFGDLDADPAFHLSKSAGVLFDPFSHSGNARSYVLFGDLHPDDWNTFVYSPIYVLLQIIWFTYFGVSVSVMHAYGAAWSLLAVGVSWLCFRRFGPLAGLLGLLFFSSHAIFAQLGRLALLENSAVFFLVLTFLTLSRELTPWRAFFCGVFSFLVFVTKATIFYAVPAAGMAVLVALVQQYLESRDWRSGCVTFCFYLLGTVVVLLPWLLLFRIPNHAEISRLGAVWWISVRPESLMHSLNYLIDDQLFAKIGRHDFLSIVLLVMGGVTAYRLLTDWRKVKPLTVMFLLCFIGGALFVGLLRYKPTRFCEPIIPVMLGMAALGLAEFYDGARVTRTFRRWWAADLVAVITLSAIFRMKLYLYEWPRSLIECVEFGWLPGQWDSLLACVLAAMVVWTCTRVALIMFLRESVEIPRWVRAVVVAAVVGHFLIGNVSATIRWWRDRDHSIVEASRRIKDQPHMVIGGLSVHALVMETGHRAVRIQHGGWHNSIGRRIFTDLGLTHLLLTDYNNLRLSYMHRFKRDMRKLKRIDAFPMCGQRYFLYEIPPAMRSAPKSP